MWRFEGQQIESILYVVTGNEARHITVKNATAANAAVAASSVPSLINYTYTNVSIDGTILSYIECDSPAILIPDGKKNHQFVLCSFGSCFFSIKSLNL